jgi:hypothetical protein
MVNDVPLKRPINLLTKSEDIWQDFGNFCGLRLSNIDKGRKMGLGSAPETLLRSNSGEGEVSSRRVVSKGGFPMVIKYEIGGAHRLVRGPGGLPVGSPFTIVATDVQID